MIRRISPLTMVLRAYSFAVICFDLIHFGFYLWFAIISAIFRTVIPRPKKKICNDVAVVVGSSRGVGRELAIQLAARGAIVACIDINANDNEMTIRDARKAGGKAFAFTCDVTNKEQVNQTVDKISQDMGHIDMMVHCCGVPSPRSYSSKSLPIKSTLDLCVVSHFWLLDAILPGMKKRRKGHIVLLASVAGASGIQHQIPLGVSQFAVQGIFETLIENVRLEKFQNNVFISLVHIYPFIVSENLANDISLRIPNGFGTISASVAAKRILDGVLRNEIDISIPKHVLYLGHAMRLLPRRAQFILRELFDTGVYFG